MQQERRTRTTPSAPSCNSTVLDPNETRVTEVASGLGRSGAPGHKPEGDPHHDCHDRWRYDGRGCWPAIV